MTSNELFNEFWHACSKAEGEKKCVAIAGALWEELVAPHLNIPRPLLADPPREGQKVIIFDLDTRGTIMRLRVGLGGFSKGNGYWMPCPSLPETSMEEIEFGRWLANQAILKDAPKERIRDIRIGWIARRAKNLEIDIT
jgi:hypothetical protein